LCRIPKNTSERKTIGEVDNPGAFSPLVVRIAHALLWPLVRLLFRPCLEGVENLPKDGPYLMVANHSAGAGVAEIICIIVLYLRHVGPDRPLALFALPQGFSVFPLSLLLKSIGAIPSTYDVARETLAKRVPILVFPGGDHETLRPIWQANRVDFGGRMGFLKIARESSVHIVPLGIHGSHYTCPILLRSQLLSWLFVVPRVIGLKRWGISLTGILGAAIILTLAPLGLEWQLLLTWVWLGSPLVFMPIVPWSIRLRIGKPLEPQELFATGADQELVDALGQVEREVELLVKGSTH